MGLLNNVMSPLFRIIQGLATNEVNHPGNALTGSADLRDGTLGKYGYCQVCRLHLVDVCCHFFRIEAT